MKSFKDIQNFHLRRFKILWKDNNISSYSDEIFRKELLKKSFLFDAVINVSKACPKSIEFSDDQIKLLKQMHVCGGVRLDENKSYMMLLKAWKAKGYFYENKKLNFFKFSIPLIGSLVYAFFSQRKKEKFQILKINQMFKLP